MALSFKDSLKQNKAKESTNKNIENEIATLASENNGRAVYSGTEVSVQDENWAVSNKYSFYNEYVDEDLSTIDKLKNITVNQNQINITQESNSQFIPFQMDRYYDGVDLMNMTLLVHFVTAQGYEGNSTPINVYYSSDKIKFGWLVAKDATSHEGELDFEIQAIGTNSKGDEYIWKTKPNGKLNILKSLSGNGVIEPDQNWITSFLNQVTEKVSQAQIAQNAAESAAQAAADSASKAQQSVDSAKTELNASVDTKISDSLKNYYTSTQVDELMKNVDLTEVYKKIDEIDGLANFNVDYSVETKTITFYNGDTVIKAITINTDPSTEWVSAYSGVVDSKISAAVEPIQTELTSYKETTDEDLKSIHQNIDSLPETLKSDYYTKEDTDNLLKDKAAASDITSLSSKINSVEQTANSNKQSITSIGTKVASLEDLISKIETEPGKTYDATYNSEDGTYTLYEITNEGTAEEVRVVKAQFKIVGGSGGGTTSTLKIEYITKSPYVITTNDKAEIKYNFSGVDSSGDEITEGTYTWKIGNTVISTGTAVAGENTFDATQYISTGSQKLLLSITDEAGTLVTKSWTVQKVDIHIESSFDDTLTYPMGTVSFDYTPYGAISKDIHFLVDEEEIFKQTTSSSGLPMSYSISAREHGAHLVDVYITAEINGSTIESNHIKKDVIWFDSTSDIPVIGCVQTKLTVQQYDTENSKHVISCRIKLIFVLTTFIFDPIVLRVIR